MKILIIGGSRFVGPYLIQKLFKNGHTITIFNRGKIESNYSHVTFIQGDRNNDFNIKDKFDVVIDMCAYKGEQTKKAIEQLNFDFFINFGTVASYKKTDKFPLTEESELGNWPLWGNYNKGKAECEKILEKSGIKYATIRPVYILGPRNYVDREHFIYSRIKQGIPLVLPGDGKAKIQFVFAKEVVDIIALLTENKIVGAFNCAGDDIITLRKLVEQMGKIVGIKPKIQFNPSADREKFKEEEFPFANESFFVSNKKIKRLGIRFTSLIKGLKEDYWNYYKNVI
ncbi:NAD-dependent epimerase/dehydratase family protein [Candidatus Micrarchaeota archaeon]|nr:NAD-dependent epimerase/dehydratase family protein [Candidatus Micrarchaeota archaeon]